MPASPEDRRHIRLGDTDIPYRLIRSQRRTIGLSVDRHGLRVGAPARARLGDIESLLYRHGQWVLRKLDAWQRIAAEPAFVPTEGATLPWLGREIRLSLAEQRGSRWSADGRGLQLPIGEPARALERALRQDVRHNLGQRLARLAAVLGVPTPPLALSSARTRWGSCNQRGQIRLNWRLGFFPPAVIDYVVAHELAHLKEMNHSSRFWSVVERLCPEWRTQRAALKALAPSLNRYWSFV